MFKSYLLLTLRHFSRNIIYVLVNILGLGLALAVCIVAYMNNKYDADFDRFHKNRNNIFRIELTHEIQGRSQPYGATPIPLGSYLAQNIDDLGVVVRVATSYSTIKLGINTFNNRVAYCDSSFLDVFTLEMVSGSAKSFHDKNSILINEELASIYFGDNDPVGKIISIIVNEDEYTYIVGGVFKTLPLNSSFTFQAITLIDNYTRMFKLDENNWSIWVAGTFVYLPDPSRVSAIKEMLQPYVAVHNDIRKDFQVESFYLYPFSTMAHHGWDIWSHWFRQSFHPAAVTAPPVMAIFILLLACFNFMNTAISFSSKRLKEIGVRKVAGSIRKQIITQFMAENFLLSFMALIVGIVVGKFLVSTYSSMWVYLDMHLSFTDNPELVLFLVILLIITVVMAGGYPSFYISRFNPVFIFQDKLKIGGKNVFSKILLTVQFIISVLALVSGIIFMQNAWFQDNIYLGYDKDHIIAIPINNPSYFIAFRDAIQSNPKIESTGESEEHIGWSNFTRVLKYQGTEREVSALDVGNGYFTTMGLQLIEGREFPRDLEQSDRETSIIVNEKLVEEYNMEHPLGEKMIMYDTVPLYIVGVMNDIYLYGVWSKIQPMMLRRGAEERMRTLVVKTSAENLREMNQYLEETWKELVPNMPYSGFFQDDLMDEARDINKNIKNIYIFLAFIAVIISTIGLYTLVSLSIVRRTKEIGIRKVNGATILKIAGILSREYIIILFIASLGGCVSGYFMSKMLMASIWEVYTEINAISFVASVILIFLVAGISIGWKVYNAARRNPSESLRYE